MFFLDIACKKIVNMG